MKIALVAMVILSVVVLLGLIFMSFKLLRKAQKDEAQQRREIRKSGNYKVHPGLAKEWEKLEEMKKQMTQKEQENNKK